MAIPGTNGVQGASAYDKMGASGKKQANNVDTGMNVTDFLKLLAAQLQNQDMMNPMDDSAFMGQLAQFTQLQTMENMNNSIQLSTELSTISYSMSLIGKEAVAATLDENGELVKTEGLITGVTMYNGTPVFYIGDKGFYLSQLMSVGKLPPPKDPPGGTEGGGGTEGDGDGTEGEGDGGTPPIGGGGDGGTTPPDGEGKRRT